MFGMFALVCGYTSQQFLTNQLDKLLGVTLLFGVGGRLDLLRDDYLGCGLDITVYISTFNAVFASSSALRSCNVLFLWCDVLRVARGVAKHSVYPQHLCLLTNYTPHKGSVTSWNMGLLTIGFQQ